MNPEIRRIEQELEADEEAIQTALAALESSKERRNVTRERLIEARTREKLTQLPDEIRAALHETDPPHKSRIRLVSRGLACKDVFGNYHWSLLGVRLRKILLASTSP